MQPYDIYFATLNRRDGRSCQHDLQIISNYPITVWRHLIYKYICIYTRLNTYMIYNQYIHVYTLIRVHNAHICTCTYIWICIHNISNSRLFEQLPTQYLFPIISQRDAPQTEEMLAALAHAGLLCTKLWNVLCCLLLTCSLPETQLSRAHWKERPVVSNGFDPSENIKRSAQISSNHHTKSYHVFWSFQFFCHTNSVDQTVFFLAKKQHVWCRNHQSPTSFWRRLQTPKTKWLPPWWSQGCRDRVDANWCNSGPPNIVCIYICIYICMYHIICTV